MIGNVVLILGQSNAMNYGTNGQAFPGGWTSDSGIQIWNNWKVTPGFETYNPGVNSNGDDASATWGPEAEFCRLRRIARSNETVYLIKHAIGGCGLAAKPAGTTDYSPHSPSKQWDAMYTVVVAAANALNAANKLAVFDTALLAFGETDSKVQADADAFKYNLAEFLTSMRARFWVQNMRAVLMRPFPNSTQGPYLATVRSGVEMVGSYPKNAWVNTDDLTESPTSPGHLDPASVVLLGSRMFASDQTIVPC